MSDEPLTIGRLAKNAGVNVETVRYYHRRGLLPVPVAPHGIRRYSEESLRRLRFIKRAQQVGFTLGEIGELLTYSEDNSCVSILGVAEHRLADIERKLADLAAMRQALQDLVAACRENESGSCCPLVDAFSR
jgi:MerR family mercuric resistance operon transcriptional regulator